MTDQKSDWLLDWGRRESAQEKEQTPEPVVTVAKGDKGQVIAVVDTKAEKPPRREDVDKLGSLV